MTRIGKLTATAVLALLAIVGPVAATSPAFAGTGVATTGSGGSGASGSGASGVGASGVGTDGTGIYVTTVNCPTMQNPKTGTAHAKIRSCQVQYIYDQIDGVNSVFVTLQLVDSSTDGHCAYAKVGGPGFSTTTFTECDGVWTTKTWSRNDPPGFTGTITITLGYGVGTPTTWTAT